MTKKERQAFIERAMMVLTSGIAIESWKQVRAAATALERELGTATKGGGRGGCYQKRHQAASRSRIY